MNDPKNNPNENQDDIPWDNRPYPHPLEGIEVDQPDERETYERSQEWEDNSWYEEDGDEF